MYKTSYQSGPSVSVFTPQGTKPCSLWKLTGSVARSYKRDILGHAVCLGDAIGTRMVTPADTRRALHLTQSFLVLQLFLDPGRPFTLSLALSTADKSATRRRIVISPSFKTKKLSPLCAQIPLALSSVLPSPSWVSLCVSLPSLTSSSFEREVFSHLDSIALSGQCGLRQIFTLLEDPSKEASKEGGRETVPAKLDFPTGMKEAPKLLVLSGEEEEEGGRGADENKAPEGREEEEEEAAAAEAAAAAAAGKKTQVAFGYRTEKAGSRMGKVRARAEGGRGLVGREAAAAGSRAPPAPGPPSGTPRKAAAGGGPAVRQRNPFVSKRKEKPPSPPRSSPSSNPPSLSPSPSPPTTASSPSSPSPSPAAAERRRTDVRDLLKAARENATARAGAGRLQEDRPGRSEEAAGGGQVRKGGKRGTFFGGG